MDLVPLDESARWTRLKGRALSLLWRNRFTLASLAGRPPRSVYRADLERQLQCVTDHIARRHGDEAVVVRTRRDLEDARATGKVAVVHCVEGGFQLVRRFTPAIEATARGYRLAPHEVDDVVQECWLALFTSLYSLREPEAIGGWLVTGARRQAMRARQSEVRELLTDEPRPVDLAAGDSPEDAVVEAEARRELWQAISALPERQRAVLERLFAGSEPSYVELSEAVGMPIGSIGPTRERASRRLRRNARLRQALDR